MRTRRLVGTLSLALVLTTLTPSPRAEAAEGDLLTLCRMTANGQTLPGRNPHGSLGRQDLSGYFVVEGLRWGQHRAVDPGGHVRGNTQLHNLKFYKALDATTPHLASALAHGHAVSATCSLFVETGGGNHRLRTRITVNEARLSRQQIDLQANGPERAEEINITYGRVDIEHFGTDANATTVDWALGGSSA